MDFEWSEENGIVIGDRQADNMLNALKANGIYLEKNHMNVRSELQRHGHCILTVSRWNASMNNDFRRRSSSVWLHLGPLNIKQGLTHVPILSFLKSCRLLYSLMPNSTISRSSCSNIRPNTKLPGLFFELEPNMKREHSFFSTKL